MITIIIPTYNRASTLEVTLPSYIDQKSVNEIIIVDDGSTDTTTKIVKKFIMNNTHSYINIRYIKHSSHRGAANARLTGIGEARNQYIIFGEDDVIFDKSYVHALYNDMEKTGADIIAGRIIYLRENESYKDAINRHNNLKKPIIDYNILEGNFGVNVSAPLNVPFVHACFLAKKEIYSKIKYDTNFQGNGYREETDPQILALKTGKRIIYTPNAICYHLCRSMAISGGQRTMNPLQYSYWTIKNNIYFLKKHYFFLAKNYQLKPKYIILYHITMHSLNRMIAQIFVLAKSKVQYKP